VLVTRREGRQGSFRTGEPVIVMHASAGLPVSSAAPSDGPRISLRVSPVGAPAACPVRSRVGPCAVNRPILEAERICGGGVLSIATALRLVGLAIGSGATPGAVPSVGLPTTLATTRIPPAGRRRGARRRRRDRGIDGAGRAAVGLHPSGALSGVAKHAIDEPFIEASSDNQQIVLPLDEVEQFACGLRRAQHDDA
jgi:hypothetical protein